MVVLLLCFFWAPRCFWLKVANPDWSSSERLCLGLRFGVLPLVQGSRDRFIETSKLTTTLCGVANRRASAFWIFSVGRGSGGRGGTGHVLLVYYQKTKRVTFYLDLQQALHTSSVPLKQHENEPITLQRKQYWEGGCCQAIFFILRRQKSVSGAVYCQRRLRSLPGDTTRRSYNVVFFRIICELFGFHTISEMP